ncbi:uncharacterized protein [Henckelia pumila]|uniref:uncharacterized protein n=1 Tax=Henckelia pumila TaxID=405737 RepID=UPI003C6E3B31
MAKNANNQANRAISEDTSSLYFLQSGDHPGLMLISTPLSGNNYNIWSRAMHMALTAKNKFGFVDGTIVQPKPDDLLYNAWVRCNSMAVSWILQAIVRDIAESLMYMSTAHEIWTDLKDRFHESNAPKIFQIKKLLSSLQQGSLDESSYYTKLRTLWDELRDFQPVSACRCGSAKEWTDYCSQECSP